MRDAGGRCVPRPTRWPRPGSTPVVLAEKEGLALINGTDGMLGMLVLACHDLRLLLRTADIAAAMSVEAQLGTDAAFAADLAELRPHPGIADSAANLRALLADSEIMESHRTPACTRVQDAYSLRCSPQVHGAARDTLAHAETVADRELASAVDNPVVTAGRPGGEQRQLPRRAGRLRAGLPGDRRGRPGLDQRAAHRPVPGRRRAATGCRRSWPPTRASTPGT